MTFPLSQNDLLQFLKEMGVEAQLEPQSKQLYISTAIDRLDFALFFSLRDHSLHLITYYPYHFQESRADGLARFLHRLNREIDMPGFGMDEGQGIIFYRTVLPCPEDRCDKALLSLHMGAHKRVIEMFHRAIFGVVSGQVDVKKTDLL